jgi:hypothetical protein
MLCYTLVYQHVFQPSLHNLLVSMYLPCTFHVPTMYSECTIRILHIKSIKNHTFARPWPDAKQQATASSYKRNICIYMQFTYWPKDYFLYNKIFVRMNLTCNSSSIEQVYLLLKQSWTFPNMLLLWWRGKSC